MSLRLQAAADLRAIVENASEFGSAISVTDPTGTTAELIGLSTDIGTTIDPETGQLVSGRRASVALSIASLTAAGLDLPVGIADRSSKPWLVTFSDVLGVSRTFKVAESAPDLALGVITCIVEAYKT